MDKVVRKNIFKSVVLPVCSSLIFFTLIFTFCIYYLNFEFSNENTLLIMAIVYSAIAYFILRLFFIKLNYPKTNKDPKLFLILFGLAIFALSSKWLQVQNLDIDEFSNLETAIQVKSNQYAFVRTPIELFPMNTKNYYLYHRAVKHGYEHNISYLMGGSTSINDLEFFFFAEASFYYGNELNFEQAYKQSKYAEQSTEKFISMFFKNGGYIKKLSINASKDLNHRHEIRLGDSMVQNGRVFAITNNPKDMLFGVGVLISVFCVMIFSFFYLIATKQFRAEEI
jgi:hypothetical protein